jgi:hypothetical protein
LSFMAYPYGVRRPDTLSWSVSKANTYFLTVKVPLTQG